jgi:plasmid stabilization system protein ParE
VHLVGTQGEDVVIWPVFIPGAPTVSDLRAAQSIHLKLAAACPYRADWEVPQAVGPSTLRARGKSQNMTAVSVFTWRASTRGTAAYFYLAGARETDFRQKQGDLAKILESFRLVGAAGGASGGGLQFVSFADPKEGAFTVEVPAGWKTSGGLFRASPFVSHTAVETDSPDGQTRVFEGDALLPSSFQEYMPGAPAWVIKPEGTNILGKIVHRYMTGAQYCRYYVESRIPTFCSDLQITDMKDHPELMALALSRDPTLAKAQFTIGSVSFSCREQGRPRTGYCTALTKRTFPPPQLQSPFVYWQVDALLGYIAPPEGVAQAEAVMNRIRDSFRFNTQWGMREIQGAGDRSRIISGATREIAGMAESSQRYRDAVDDRIARLRSNATLGVADVVDSATGRRMTVDSGSGYYWVDHRGMILGTNVDTSPGVDFRRLLELR